MTRLVLGPLLRYAGETEATIWVETDGPCTVEVLGHRERTFAVAGHHYALVRVAGLPRDAQTPYEVQLDGAPAWPPPDAPPSLIRTQGRDGPVRIAFGSCRICAPRGPDALRLLAERLRRGDPATWPHALMLLGDQMYADDPASETRAFIRSRRDAARPPGEQVADFEEYAHLYRTSWGEPLIRWLLSTLPTAMIFDDHDVHDDWNTSDAWVREKRAQSWWGERIVGAFMSYWLYQHLGNLEPRELEADELYARVRDEADGTAALREFAARADRDPSSTRWSFARAIGPARLIAIDTRAGRVLDPGRRSMLDAGEWAWLEDQATGGVEHLLIGSSLPLLLAPSLHHVEAWNEAVCDGVWGAPAARLAERARQGLDLEHWAAFRASFQRIWELLGAVGAGRRGPAPSSIVVLSGDVHHAYLADVAFPRSAGVRSAVWQAVCSPFRNPLADWHRAGVRFAFTRASASLTRAFARAARVPDPPVRWRLLHGPWFDNQVAMLDLDGSSARLTLERALGAGAGERLERVLDRRLA